MQPTRNKRGQCSVQGIRGQTIRPARNKRADNTAYKEYEGRQYGLRGIRETTRNKMAIHPERKKTDYKE